jgi:putative oxidoreductase
MERVNDTVLLVGRLLMAALFLNAGIPKALGFISGGEAYGNFLKSVTGSGLPYPEIWALVGIAIEVLAPIALILGIFPRISSLFLIAFVIIATAIAHRYWEFVEPVARRNQNSSFFKNVGIIGGLLFYYASGPGAFALAGRGAASGVGAHARA